MSIQKHLHLIAPYIPFPTDFGGAIDVFYRIVALKELGVRIHLHCFEYNRGNQKNLKTIAKKFTTIKGACYGKSFFQKCLT